METLMQIVKRLSEDDYQMLLSNISSDKFSKPYIVLEAARYKVLTDAQMIEILDINPSTYYTLKSRLHSKVAAILSKKVENPISELMNEVSRVPASLYGTNKQVAIRSLKELEKQLLEYDLSNELIIVYHSLARMHMYREEHQHYHRLYNKFVAFSLASEKAENVFYDFIFLAGEYQLCATPEILERMESCLRELSNIAELYSSHRLFVFYNIMRIYFMLITVSNSESLVLKEMEIDKTLQEIKAIFDKYPLDTFYNAIKFIIDALHFEYYEKIKNVVRATHHFNNIIDHLSEYASHYILNFHVVQFLNAKIAFCVSNHDDKLIREKNEAVIHNLYIETEEFYNYYSFQKYQAIVKYYEGSYDVSTGILNNLRSHINLKPYWLVEMDCKLFQAFQHAIMKEEGACRQLLGNMERNLRARDKEYANIKLFIKLIKASLQPQESAFKANKISNLWDSFTKKNTGSDSVLNFLMLDEKVIQKMTSK